MALGDFIKAQIKPVAPVQPDRLTPEQRSFILSQIRRPVSPFETWAGLGRGISGILHSLPSGRWTTPYEELPEASIGLPFTSPFTGEQARLGTKSLAEFLPDVIAFSGVPANVGIRGIQQLAPRAGESLVAKIGLTTGQVVLAPIAGAEIATGAALKYGVVIPVKAFGKAVSAGGKKSVEQLLDTGIDKWIASQGRLAPEGQSALGKFIVGNKTKIVEYATNNLKRRMGEAAARRQGLQATAKIAVDDTIKDIEKNLVPEFSKTRTEETIASIRAGKFEGRPAPSVQAAQAGRMELGGEAEASRLFEAEAELEGLKEYISSEPASKLLNLIKKTGWYKGEVNNLTLKQYRDLTGRQDIPPNILTPDKKHVRWEYTLDQFASERGYESAEALKEAIEKVGMTNNRIKELEKVVTKGELYTPEKPVPEAGTSPVAPEPTTAPVAGVTPPEVPTKPPISAEHPPPAKPPVAEIPTEQPPPSRAEPSLSEMSRIIEQSRKVVEADRPGKFTRILDRIPVVKKVIEFERPGLKMTGDKEKILIGHVAESQARNDVITRAIGSRANIVENLKETFGRDALHGSKTNIEFVGTPEQAKNPITGTLKDIADNPELYNLSDAQKAVLTELDQRNAELLNRVVDGYGAEIGRYPAKEGGAFLPNVDISEDVVEAVGGELRVVASGRQKTRFYPSARERMLHDKSFKPELNIEKLLDGMDRAKARAAGGQTFRAELAGKTRLEVMQETHPQLATKMEALKKRLNSLRGSAGRLDEKLDKAVSDFLSGPMEGQDMTQLQASLDVKLSRGPRAGMTREAIQKEIDGVRAQIKALKPAWDVANLKPYQFVQEGIFRYFPADQAKIIRELRKTSSNPLLNFIENVRGTAFSGDLSPIIGVQTPVGILADPIGALTQAGGGIAKAIKTKDPLVSFKVDELAKEISQAPDDWAQFFSLLGRAPAGTPQEFAGGFLSKIPGFSKFTESTFVLVTRQAKNLYDVTWKSLVKFGMAEQDAKIVAITTAERVFPHLNPQRLGQSPERATFIRALPTSYSFIRKPAEMITDAAKGFAKLGTFQVPRAREWMAMKIVVTMAATAAVTAAVSQALDAHKRKGDIEQAIKDAVNPDPMNGKFLSIVAGNYRVPIGGPYRALFRAIYPQKVTGVPFPVPFAGLVNYLSNRINPAVRTQIDLIKNEDYYGQKIRSGDVPHQILQILAYEIEGVLPLTAGSAMEAARTGMTQQEAITQSVGQFAGVNVIENLWYEVSTLGDMYSKQDYDRPYEDLPSALRKELRRNHQDLEQAYQEALESRRQPELDKKYNEISQQAIDKRNKAMNEASQALRSGTITKYDYDNERSYVRPYYSGQRNALWQLTESMETEDQKARQLQYEETATDEDKAMDAYQEYYSQLMANAPLPIDWDVIDKELNNFLSQYPERIRTYVLQHENDWILDLPEPARSVEFERLRGIENGTWWNNYRGTERVQAPKISGIPKQRTSGGIKIPVIR